MDPYLEQFWNDVHGKLVPYIADELNEVLLPAGYRATMQNRIVISEFEELAARNRFPDVAVIEWPAAKEQGGVATAAHSQRLRVPTPDLITYASETLKQYFIEIVDGKSGNQVITAIEVLSPENKRQGDGMEKFRLKQAECRSAGISRIEIDLLRSGRRVFEFPIHYLKPEQIRPYYVTVHRSDRPNEAELYTIDLRDRLPIVLVPLRPGDPDVRLDLQPLVDHVYRAGRFAIDYTQPCDPPLTGKDEIWAQEIIAKR